MKKKNGKEYMAAAGSVYELKKEINPNTWIHIGKLNGKTLKQLLEEKETEELGIDLIEYKKHQRKKNGNK